MGGHAGLVANVGNVGTVRINPVNVILAPVSQEFHQLRLEHIGGHGGCDEWIARAVVDVFLSK